MLHLHLDSRGRVLQLGGSMVDEELHGNLIQVREGLLRDAEVGALGRLLHSHSWVWVLLEATQSPVTSHVEHQADFTASQH